MCSRRFFSWLLAIALGAVGGTRTNAAAPAALGLRKIVLQTDWFPQAEHGGFYQAVAKGYYTAAGLDVDILSGGPGVTIRLNVVKGDADFGMYRSDDVIVAASRGMPLIMVGVVLQHDPEVLLVHEGSPVRSLADLAGHTVIAPLSAAWIPYVQKKFGIAFNLVPKTQGFAAFLGDKTVIMQGISTSEPYFIAQHGVKFRMVPIAGAEYDSYHVLMCRRELVRTSPEVVRAFLAASIRGWRDYLEGDPAPANELILKRNPQMSAEQIAFSRQALIAGSLVQGDPKKGEGIGQLALERIERQIALLTDLKIVDVPVKLETVATREFLPPVSLP